MGDSTKGATPDNDSLNKNNNVAKITNPFTK